MNPDAPPSKRKAGKKLSATERQNFEVQAYKRSLEGASAPQIASEIGVDESTVDRLLKSAVTKRAKALDRKAELAAAQLEDEARAVINDAWQRLREENGASVPIASLQKNVLSAIEMVGKARGVFIQRTDITSGNKPLDFAALMKAALEEDSAGTGRTEP